MNLSDFPNIEPRAGCITQYDYFTPFLPIQTSSTSFDSVFVIEDEDGDSNRSEICKNIFKSVEKQLQDMKCESELGPIELCEASIIDDSLLKLDSTEALLHGSPIEMSVVSSFVDNKCMEQCLVQSVITTDLPLSISDTISAQHDINLSLEEHANSWMLTEVVVDDQPQEVLSDKEIHISMHESFKRNDDINIQTALKAHDKQEKARENISGKQQPTFLPILETEQKNENKEDLLKQRDEKKGVSKKNSKKQRNEKKKKKGSQKLGKPPENGKSHDKLPLVNTIDKTEESRHLSDCAVAHYLLPRINTETFSIIECNESEVAYFKDYSMPLTECAAGCAFGYAQDNLESMNINMRHFGPVCQVEEIYDINEEKFVEDLLMPLVEVANGKTVTENEYLDDFRRVVSVKSVSSANSVDGSQKIFLLDEVCNTSEIDSQDDSTAELVCDYSSEEIEAYATESDESVNDLKVVEISGTVCYVDQLEEIINYEEVTMMKNLSEDYVNTQIIVHEDCLLDFHNINVNVEYDWSLIETVQGIEDKTKYQTEQGKLEVSATNEEIDNLEIKIPEFGETNSWLDTIRAYQGSPVMGHELEGNDNSEEETRQGKQNLEELYGKGKEISSASESDQEFAKLHILDRVSEELKTMISGLEHNLATGTSKNVKITPILAKLEQLEEEVANLSPVIPESSISNLLFSSQIDYSMSIPQASVFEGEGDLQTDELRIDTHQTGNIMPVGVLPKPKPVALGIPGAHSNGNADDQDIEEALTDVEELYDEKSPIMLQKSKQLQVPKGETGGITDTEDMDLSGEEEDFIPSRKNLPSIQDLGILPEPVKEVVNLTEGYARAIASPLLSDSDSEKEDVEKRHKKNLKRGDTIDRLKVDDDEGGLDGVTDTEDMMASGDDMENVGEIDDSLPEHYMDQGEGVSNQEKLKTRSPKPKVFVEHAADSTDDEAKDKGKEVRKRSKATLKVQAVDDGATDVEELVVSDRGEDGKKISQKAPERPKIRRKKQIKRAPVTKPKVNLTAPNADEDGVTDTEILTGDDYESEEDYDDTFLSIPGADGGAITDTEDLEASDAEDINDMVPSPVEKICPNIIPEPLNEETKITEVEEAKLDEDEQGDTDEEGFQIDEKEDAKPLMPRKTVVTEPRTKIERKTLEPDEPCEDALTDTEDMGFDEKDEDEIIEDVKSRIPEEGEIYTIKALDENIGQVSKKEMIRDHDKELKKMMEEVAEEGLTLQEALKDVLTDVEEIDEDGNSVPRTKRYTKSKKQHEDTDEESVNESDVEEEIKKPQKQPRRKGKRLPLVPQVSEVRFVETEKGPLSIIITPDNLDEKPDSVLKDQITGVVFLETDENDEAVTDVEDLSDEEGKKKMVAPELRTEPATDTEDFEVDASELERPYSPLPPNIKYNVLSSPKRELIHIKEDKYGVPQVSIRKLKKDELLISDVEDMGLTDTEDLEVSDNEAMKLHGIQDDIPEFKLPDTEFSEVASKMASKKQKQGLKVDTDDDGGNTDIEELLMSKKPKRKGKNQNKLHISNQDQDSHTDIELLSDQDEKNLKVKSTDSQAHTDLEDFDASDIDELEVPSRDNAKTPDIIKNAAIKSVIHLKEGPDGITQTEDATIVTSNYLQLADEPEGLTDMEDMEASELEDEVEHPAVDLPENESSNISVSVKSKIPKDLNEAKHVKDNLLLPEDNFNNLTDVESLEGGEAHSMFGKRPGIESFFYKGFFLPKGTLEATQADEQTSITQSQEEAQRKSNLTEADLAVLESMVLAQEAEMEEMAFVHEQAQTKQVQSHQFADIKVKQNQVQVQADAKLPDYVHEQIEIQTKQKSGKIKKPEATQIERNLSEFKSNTCMEVKSKHSSTNGHQLSNVQNQDTLRGDESRVVKEPHKIPEHIEKTSQIQSQTQKYFMEGAGHQVTNIPTESSLEKSSASILHKPQTQISKLQVQGQIQDDQISLISKTNNKNRREELTQNTEQELTSSISTSEKQVLESYKEQQQQLGDLSKIVADVASSMASTLESISVAREGLEGGHLSSDEGEEQLMLMRDSPRWEDEEIQADDTDEPRAIKAEIKLLVKTTELGKESIEIRSIREFVETEEKNLSGFGGIVPSPIPETGRITPQGDRVYTLQRGSPSTRTPSPRFVRQHQTSPVSSQPSHDEFDLMAQVRDVVQLDSGLGAQQAPGSSGGRKSKKTEK